jgi:hypothetical protein
MRAKKDFILISKGSLKASFVILIDLLFGYLTLKYWIIPNLFNFFSKLKPNKMTLQNIDSVGATIVLIAILFIFFLSLISIIKPLIDKIRLTTIILICILVGIVIGLLFIQTAGVYGLIIELISGFIIGCTIGLSNNKKIAT